MKFAIAFVLTMTLSISLNAQLALIKYVGKDKEKFALGYGAFLKFAYSQNSIDDITAELGANIINEKKDQAYGIINIPFKLGYRYKINRSPSGFYVEPQVGYNFYGVQSYYSAAIYKNVDVYFKGIVLSPGIGYLFKKSGGVQFNVEARYETTIVKDGSYNYFVFRLSHNFSFGKRE
jgi:hypothetical protein